jgi:hypothetical protein
MYLPAASVSDHWRKIRAKLTGGRAVSPSMPTIARIVMWFESIWDDEDLRSLRIRIERQELADRYVIPVIDAR